MKFKFQTIPGEKNLSGKELKIFSDIEKSFRNIVSLNSFKKIETPIIENAFLFEKAIGANSSFINQKMISFHLKNGRVALRPEWFSSLIKIKKKKGMDNSPQLVKFWFSGPYFRKEETIQKNKVGLEIIGAPLWVADVQVIQILFNTLKENGLKNLLVRVNSVGDSQCQPGYKKALSAFLRKYKNKLCLDCQQKIKTEPLRILACQNENCRKIIRSEAPQTVDYLCRDCHNHLKNVLEGLEGLDIPYILDPYLVGEFNYYSRTVFEIIQDNASENEKGKILAYGGRHDNLAKNLAGEEIPSVGGIININEVAGIIRGKKKKGQVAQQPRIFLAQIGLSSKVKALKLLEKFRKEKIKVAELMAKDSLSLQFKKAERLKIKNILIIGEKEAIEDSIIIRDTKTGKQKTVPLKNIIKEIKKLKN